jgi:hypothetical protein
MPSTRPNGELFEISWSNCGVCLLDGLHGNLERGK